MATTCLLYGLGLRVNVPIAALVGLPIPERIDVDVRISEMPAEVASSSGDRWEDYFHSEDEDHLGRTSVIVGRWPDGSLFRILYADGTSLILDAQGTKIWATAPPGATVDDTATYLLGPAMGFLLRRRGTTCLHASAVEIGGKAVALVGPSGAGKSTTAAAFARLGYPVLSDDVVALSDRPDGFWIHPAYPRVRLWPESVAGMFGDEDALERITPGWDKRFLDLNHPRYTFQNRPLPLGAIYLLDHRTADATECVSKPENPSAALMALISDTTTTRMLDSQTRAGEFAVLAKLVRSVPVRRITAIDDLAKIDSLCHAVVRDLDSLQVASTQGR